jgi:hypothetical protein
MKRVLKYSDSTYTTLARNGRHSFAHNHALCIYRSDSIYTFIPKNGCSTMRLSLAMANGCIKSSADFNWIHENNSTFRATLSELIKAKYTFVILRDPYKRLASVYLDKIVDRSVEAWHLYDLLARKMEIEELSFRKFVEAITKDSSLLRANQHWRPQVDFLVYEKYDDYFLLERFEKAIPLIEKRAKIRIYDARALTRHGTDRYEKISKRCYTDTPASDISRMKRKGKIPSHMSLYDKELKKLVKKAYAEDFTLYKRVSRG